VTNITLLKAAAGNWNIILGPDTSG